MIPPYPGTADVLSSYSNEMVRLTGCLHGIDGNLHITTSGILEADRTWQRRDHLAMYLRFCSACTNCTPRHGVRKVQV